MRTTSRSSTATDLLHNPRPGETLLEEFLTTGGLSQTRLARAVGVPPRRINDIVLGKRAVTADTDLRLACYFGMSDGFFLGLQTDYELIERGRQVGEQLEAIRPRAACRLLFTLTPLPLLLRGCHSLLKRATDRDVRPRDLY